MLGLFISLLGLAASFLPLSSTLDEGLGLALLFRLRGTREAPQEILIATIDQESAKRLKISEEPQKWPRSLHAELVKKLNHQGAAVIAFDINFDEPRSGQGDMVFADAIRDAQNVVLYEYLKKETLPSGTKNGILEIERLMPPLSLFAKEAAAIAPFPLPKVPVRVNRYWTFKSGAGDTPTLPATAFQIFSAEVYDDFVSLLRQAGIPKPLQIPTDHEALLSGRGIEKVVRSLKNIFDNEPLLARKMLDELNHSGNLSGDKRRLKLLTALINMYTLDNAYLNFYGVSGTIKTIPYYKLIEAPEQFALKGKAVFVGLSDAAPMEQTDSYYTIFSKNGINLNGVEIMATAFANLFEDMPVRPVSSLFHILTVLLWGVVLGGLCLLLPDLFSAISVLALSSLYLVITVYQFTHTGIWCPVMVPLFFQAPLSFVGAILWKHREAGRERRNIRKAFGYYLPNEAVDQLMKNLGKVTANNKVVYGVCLSTDAEHYTALSEAMAPKELGDFLNRYYAAIFEPVKRHGGVVSNVIGDSMMAVWATTRPDDALREQACLAAIDIDLAVQEFNKSAGRFQLPTRIGLHTGEILIGHIGGMDHYEYRPVGDIVNTASRIEGLNKFLGTKILASGESVSQNGSFQSRELGQFLMAGKAKPLVIKELLTGTNMAKQKESYAAFAEGLEAFRGQNFELAIKKFYATIEGIGEDGPSRFYIGLCERYLKEQMTDVSWDGVVRMEKK